MPRPRSTSRWSWPMSELVNEPYYRRDLALVHHRGLRLPRRRVRARILRAARAGARARRPRARDRMRERAAHALPRRRRATACSPPTRRPRCSSSRATTAPGAEAFARLDAARRPGARRPTPSSAIGHPLCYLPTRRRDRARARRAGPCAASRRGARHRPRGLRVGAQRVSTCTSSRASATTGRSSRVLGARARPATCAT